MERTDIQRSTVPTGPGVYLFKQKGGTILYIGKAKHLKKRLQHYFTPSSVWKQDMVNKAYQVEWLPTTTEQEAILLETNMIHEHTPTYNNLIKGHTSYVYIKIPDEPYPNILLSRYKKSDKSVYIGPKVRHRDLKHTLRLMRQLLQYRSCPPTTFATGHVCSDYFFGLCKGWCAYHAQLPAQSNGWTPVYTPAQAEEAYEAIIRAIGQFFQGRSSYLKELIQQHLAEAIQQEHFEWAAKLRDMYMSIEHISEKQHVILSSPKSGIFVLLKEHLPRRVVTIIRLEEGRIVDAITHREYQEDIDRDELLRMIEREFSLELTTEEEGNQLRARGTPTKRSFNKKDRKLLQTHALRFLEEHTKHPHQETHDAKAMQALLEDLQSRYELPVLPVRMECIDISHFGGDWTVGGLSAMHRGRTDPSRYRRYRIQGVSNDDYAALAEVLVRRVQSSDPLPDLFILDGGLGQLNVVTTLLREDSAFKQLVDGTHFASLGKGKARSRKGKSSGHVEQLLLLDPSGNVQTHDLTYTKSDQLLTHIRDEAHRFANTYRKTRMKNEFS